MQLIGAKKVIVASQTHGICGRQSNMPEVEEHVLLRKILTCLDSLTAARIGDISWMVFFLLIYKIIGNTSHFHRLFGSDSTDLDIFPPLTRQWFCRQTLNHPRTGISREL
jgi:hypothetical protein